MRAQRRVALMLVVSLGLVLGSVSTGARASASAARPGDTVGRLVSYISGMPVPDCLIEFVDQTRVDYTGITSDFLHEYDLWQPTLVSRTRSASDGTFAVPLLPSRYSLSATCGAGGIEGNGPLGMFDVAPGGTNLGDVSPVQPANPPLYALAGRVTGPDGEPVQGVHVTVVAPDGTASYPISTAADGTYRLLAAAGSYDVRFQTQGTTALGSSRANVELGPGGATLDARLETGVAVSGVVTHDGAGAALISVCLADGDSSSVPPFACSLTDGSGRYAFSGVAPGYYTVNASGGEYDRVTHKPMPWTTTVALLPSQPVLDANITLNTAAPVSGRVVDQWGQPVEGVPVVESTSEPWNYSQVTGPDGRFSFTAHAGIPLVVRVNTVASFGPLTGGLFAGDGELVGADEADATPVTPGTSPIDLGDAVLDACGSVSGFVGSWDVLDDRFARDNRLTVEVISKDGLPVRIGSVASDGSFSVSGLLPGRYYVALHMTGYGPNEALLETDRYLWGADPFIGSYAPLYVGPACTAVRGLQLTTEPVADSSVVAAIPTRLSDSAVQGFGAPQCMTVSGQNVPTGASGVLVNVTSASPGTVGNALLFPDDGSGHPDPPRAVSVSFEPGKDVAAAAFVPVGPNGRICLYSQSFATSRVLVDVVGFTMPGSGIVLQAAQRLLDTRPGSYHVGEMAGPMVARTPYEVTVAGRAGVPADAAAVIVDVTVVQPSGVGNLRMYPANGRGAPPEVSTLNYVPGTTKSTAAVVPLSGTRIGLYSDTFSSTPVDVVLDVVGYVAADSETYRSVPPTRVLDTRGSADSGLQRLARLFAGGVASFDVRTAAALPPEASTVVLNVTAIGPTTVGNLRVYPDTAGNGSTSPPNASSINYVPGRDIPNLVIVAVPPDGRIDFYSDQLSGGTVDLAVDVVGYLTTGTG